MLTTSVIISVFCFLFLFIKAKLKDIYICISTITH